MNNFQVLTKEEFNTLQKRQFVRVEFDLIRNRVSDMYKHKDEFLIYTWMTSNIVRERWDDDLGFPLKSEFYEKNYLVCSFSLRKLAEVLGISVRGVQYKIKKMEELRWIDIAKVKGTNKFREQNVYILGEWKLVVVEEEKKYIEELYINHRW